MVRKARGRQEEGVYHVIQIAYETTRLFESELDRMSFLGELQRLQKQMNFDLISYCLAEDIGYQLVIRLYGTDLSKAMKSLNIAYAMYKKSENPLFKDRYKSTKIESESELEAVLAQIHCERHANSPWNACCKKMGSHEGDSLCLRTLEDARNWFLDEVEKSGHSWQEIKKDKALRNEWVFELRKLSTLSLKEIGHVFEMSESSICKILRKASNT